MSRRISDRNREFLGTDTRASIWNRWIGNKVTLTVVENRGSQEGWRMDVQQTLHQYEQAANSRDFDQVAPIIADHAVYWFSDGEFQGLDAIRRPFEMTWNTIEHERYVIDDVQSVVVGDRAAVCLYQFRSEGIVRGRPFSAIGRGTNVFALIDDRWKIVHEHLSRAANR